MEFPARDLAILPGLLLAAACALAQQAEAPSAGPTGGSAVPAAIYKQSMAADPRGYRKDGASHIYEKYRQRVFKGRMPPLLRAVGVLQVEVNETGAVERIHWMRAPRHVPEVMAEIERMVREAAPFPAPAKLGRVTYTDVWLWHRSGRFQLDTLTEGQD